MFLSSAAGAEEAKKPRAKVFTGDSIFVDKTKVCTRVCVPAPLFLACVCARPAVFSLVCVPAPLCSRLCVCPSRCFLLVFACACVSLSLSSSHTHTPTHKLSLSCLLLALCCLCALPHSPAGCGTKVSCTACRKAYGTALSTMTRSESMTGRGWVSL